MRRLQEFQPAELHERDVAPRQFELQRRAVRAGAKQHRLLLQAQAFLAPGQGLVGHAAGLVELVGHGHQLRAGGLGAVGVQAFVGVAGRLGDHGIGAVQDGLGAAVVALQRHHGGRRLELLRKAQDVAHLGAAEGVDALRVVAHHGEAGAIGLQATQDGGLQAVGVLVLVDEHLVEARAQVGGQRGLGQQALPGQQQVVIVQRGLGVLVVGIGAEQLRERIVRVQAPGVLRGQHLAQRRLGVQAA